MGQVRQIQSLTLPTLIGMSKEQARRYRELGAAYADPRYCYELFRRALVERNELAWGGVYEIYRPQVIRWLRQSGDFRQVMEDNDALVNVVFGKLWRAVDSESFAWKLKTLGAVLVYLKRCAYTTVIDEARSRRHDQKIDELGVVEHQREMGGDFRPIEDMTNRKLVQRQLWQKMATLIKDDREKCILDEALMLGKKAREIYADNRHLFDDISLVYRTKENMMKRLRRNPDIIALRELV